MAATVTQVTRAGIPHAVHGMGRETAEPDWPPLTDDEVRAVLSGPGEPVVTWRSPRPMSAAALVRAGDPPGPPREGMVRAGDPPGPAREGMVRAGDAVVFVKRHHVSVRAPAQLAAEHVFIEHLRGRGQPAPAVLRLPGGSSVLRRGDWCYEAHHVADGVDLYRDAVSWSPYASLGHAYAAGAALARLHLAAADFAAPARPFAALMTSCQVITAPDPLAEVGRLAAARPALAAYLDPATGRRWPGDFEDHLAPLIARAAPLLRALPAQWGHGDWHPSNLTWTSTAPDARVAGVFDFGLANRTSAVHDLAVALERAVVSWLDLPETGTARADLGAAAVILDGYQTARPLSDAEAAALPLVLPVAHVEYALSEIDYFAGVTGSPGRADLAYEYLVGHARWFGGPEGSALLGFLRRHLRRG